ncbi:MAG: BACON domain-containing protein [Candidatus Brocadiales bacterium]
MFVFLCVCVLILSTTTALWADESESQSASAGTTRSWSDLAPEAGAAIPALGEEQGVEHPLLHAIPEEEIEWLKHQPYTPSADEYLVTNEVDLSVSGLAPEAKAATVNTSFEGMDVDSQPAGISRPPDPHAAAGPSHIVTVVNQSLAVYDKTGTQLKSASFASWWADVYTASNPFDPRVVYDHNEGHWIMMALGKTGSTTSKFLLSVSKTNDPTGDWWNWALEGALMVSGSNTWADYPDVGFDDISSGSGGAVYLTANQFTFSGNSFKTSVLLILPKSSLYTGSSFSYWRAWDRTDGDGGQAFTLRTAVTFGTPGAEYLVDSDYGTSNFVTLWKVVPTFPGTAVNWTRQATISIGSYSLPPDAEQLGCANTLDTIDTRMYNCVYRDGYVYCAFCEDYNWGSGTVAAIRYLKLNTTNNTADLDIRYGADGYYYWMPSICPDGSNNIALVFAQSSTGEYASLRAAYRESGAGSTSSSILLKAGEECITGSRWGDYFAASLDPSNSNLVWVYGEYAKDVSGVSSTWDWGTWVASISFDACTYSISPTSASATVSSGTGSVTVTATVSCSWTAVSNKSWITVTSGSSGTGSGTVGYSVAANSLNSVRSGTITIAGDTFTVSQAGVSCTYSISPTSVSPAASGGTGSVTVTAAASDCSWTAVSNKSWITVTSGSSSTGDGTAGYSVAANTGSISRTGTITIAGDTFTVTQSGTSAATGEADLIGDWPPNGTWAYMNDSTWKRITKDSPGVGMATGDLDGNGKDDLIGDWPPNGTWAYMNDTNWKRITKDSPGAGGLVCGNLDGN